MPAGRLQSLRAPASQAPAGRRPGRPGRGRSSLRRWLLVGITAVMACGVLLGLAFAGSPATLPEGVRIAGVDVGGLSATAARRQLERRSASLGRVPVTFVAGTHRWSVTPRSLGVEVDWAAAVEAAHRQGGGFGPVRGFRRLQTRFFGAELAPPTRIWDGALVYTVKRMAKVVDRRPQNASVQLRGLTPVIAGGSPGLALERDAAELVVARALASFSRRIVGLPVRVTAAEVRAANLRPALRQAKRALSAPVRLRLGTTRWRLPRWRIAELLSLPRAGSQELSVGGAGADRYFRRLSTTVEQEPEEASFVVSGSTVSVLPSRPGLGVDVPATRRRLLAALRSRSDREARLVVRTTAPARTTAGAKRMGITGLVGGYTTEYGGEPNRLHNVRLVAELIDGALVAPGATFSFNETTGERTAEKGFLEAPVIINGELQTGLGGGICQVSTTVFNAAYEAGLEIATRTNHALYISHYPLGRDATVNYPDLDLRFRNDTSSWLLLRTFVGDSALTVNLYGSPAGRRVETEAAPLVERAAAPVQRIADKGLLVGEQVLVQGGQPARSTSVRRRVYDAGGTLLHDTTWSSYYRSERAIVRVGSKPKPKPKVVPEVKPKPSDTPAGSTTTATTEPDKAAVPPPPPAAGDTAPPPPGPLSVQP